MLDTRAFDLQRVLARLPLFADVDEAALARIAAGSLLRRVERGAHVFRQGDPCEHFHVVIGGQVKLAALSPAGQEKIIEIVGPGGSFAEALMFLGRPCVVGAQALVDSTLVSVGRAAVMAELGADPAFALRMLAGLSRRLHGLVHDVQAQALQSGVQRVIGYLLHRADAEAEADGDDAAAAPRTVTLPVSKAALASRLSLTPEYFSRVLRELEDAALVRVEGRHIHVPDAARLAAYTRA